MVKKYRKRPLVIEAIQYEGTPESINEIEEWVVKNWPELEGNVYGDTYGNCIVQTDVGLDFVCAPKDWFIKGVDGSLYPVENDTFMKTYDEVSEEETKSISW